jgi:hypothetical protein
MKWGFIHEHSVSARSASVEFPCAFPRACRWDPIPKSTHHTALRSARSPQEPIPRVPTTVDRTVDSTRYTPLPRSPAAQRAYHTLPRIPECTRTRTVTQYASYKRKSSSYRTSPHTATAHTSPLRSPRSSLSLSPTQSTTRSTNKYRWSLEKFWSYCRPTTIPRPFPDSQWHHAYNPKCTAMGTCAAVGSFAVWFCEWIIIWWYHANGA